MTDQNIYVKTVSNIRQDSYTYTYTYTLQLLEGFILAY